MGSAAADLLSLKSAANREHSNKITRRGVMKGFGKTSIGLWLSSHIPEGLARRISYKDFTTEPDENSNARKLEKFFIKLNSNIHPETRTIAASTRNIIIAQKSEYVAKQLAKSLGKKPEIAIIVGGAHTGIEDELLKTKEERIQELKESLEDDFKKQGKIIMVQSTSNGKALSASLLEDPEFKK